MSPSDVRDPRRDHWPRHARQWALVGPPLRPGPDDVAVMEAIAAAAAPAGAPLRAVLLGVTPELVTLRWPAGSAVLAVDRSRDVIGSIFPAAAAAAAGVVVATQGDWLALPCGDQTRHLVLGDGSLTNLGFPAGYRALAAELARVLVPGGRLALRLFAAPARRESLAEVAAALAAGRIGSINSLKWRLAMAVQPDTHNLPVTDILGAFDELVPDRAALAARLGWPRAAIDAVDVYRGSSLVYSFPTVDEVRAALAPWFTEHSCLVPAYELGDRCPTLVLTRAAGR